MFNKLVCCGRCRYCVYTNSVWFQLFVMSASVPCAVNMDAGEDQNTGTTNGTPQTGGNSRAPQIAHMSLYERQAVQVCRLSKLSEN